MTTSDFFWCRSKNPESSAGDPTSSVSLPEMASIRIRPSVVYQATRSAFRSNSNARSVSVGRRAERNFSRNEGGGRGVERLASMVSLLTMKSSEEPDGVPHDTTANASGSSSHNDLTPDLIPIRLFNGNRSTPDDAVLRGFRLESAWDLDNQRFPLRNSAR